jgi:DNA (cytosine-5)-methyltransferase 1
MIKNKHAWLLSDLPDCSNGPKVMTTFSCGGGSSMGYKLAGCNVIAANDIDLEMAYHYKLNLKPKHYFLMPIKDLISKDLPDELYDLDILDGSPPCSSFSVAGNRDKDWGKKKHFREGQAEQILDDLFFDYLNLVEKLKPKVSIAENVKGMTVGNAKGYLKLIFARYKEIGYTPQLFLINAKNCGVPQSRERVFFCAFRNDLAFPSLTIAPSYPWISASSAVSDLKIDLEERKETVFTQTDKLFWPGTKPGDSYQAECLKQRGKKSFFNHVKLDRSKPSPTLSAQHHNYSHWSEPRLLTLREWIRLGSFPDDYQVKNKKIGKYMIGMSVPPRMTEFVARAVIDQWVTYPTLTRNG